MVLSQLCGRIKIIILGIIGAFRRALCCFSRRRKPSQTDCEILQSVNVVSDTGRSTEVSLFVKQLGTSLLISIYRQGGEKDWNSWDDTPRTVQEHIDHYRQKLARPPTPKEPEPEPDFFQDMTPQIKPQPKIFIPTKLESTQTDFSRLQATTDIPIPLAADLQDWAEEDPGGWEELDSETATQLIREKRKEQRAQKQSRTREQAATKVSPVNFAERIGTRHS
ncbi:receptor-binding cancer antigen expressed on SiSo cells isoform X1 [Hermetia illucens]|uniref:receptor-binding cancer antigen expressed on SiSo cells isoform X1 n=1 Tax=Hermetia illucens TaxID=343691 RepID=UPI0018CC3E99|nr:receptor-binding cancer antigen expressed on SiSo cells isoform X1 [Hermetia illucens]